MLSPQLASSSAKLAIERGLPAHTLVVKHIRASARVPVRNHTYSGAINLQKKKYFDVFPDLFVPAPPAPIPLFTFDTTPLTLLLVIEDIYIFSYYLFFKYIKYLTWGVAGECRGCDGGSLGHRWSRAPMCKAFHPPPQIATKHKSKRSRGRFFTALQTPYSLDGVSPELPRPPKFRHQLRDNS